MSELHNAIAIHAAARVITEQRMSFADAQKFVGGWLEPVRIDQHRHVLYVDEEGLLKELRCGFAIRDYAQLLRGNGVIFGCLPDLSDDTDCTLTLVDVNKRVTFWTHDHQDKP